MNHQSLGYHMTADLFGCNPRKIDDREFVREAMLHAARLANATVVTDVFHSFNPYGLSGVVVIAESHLAIHSWPEHGCVALDVFSCSEKMHPQSALDYLKIVFEAQEITIQKTERGVFIPKTKPTEVPA